MHRPSYGVVMAGRGAAAIPLPMAKPGCGGWLYAVFCQASAVPLGAMPAGGDWKPVDLAFYTARECP